MSLAFKNEQIRKFVGTISEQNDLLKKQQFQISQINEDLERLVTDKNPQLIDRNSRLKEYAFMNSHLLRKPVGNLIGLLKLLQKQDTRHNPGFYNKICAMTIEYRIG